MSAVFESCVVFAVMSIMVVLFAWIYSRDRQARTRLWLLGWIAVLIHFSAPPLSHLSLLLLHVQGWIKITALLVAGTFFLMSVSEIFATRRRRIGFLLAISLASLVYVTALLVGVQQKWVFIGLLLTSTLFGFFQAVYFYGLRSSYLFSLFLLLPYAGWVMWCAKSGNFCNPASLV